MYYKNISANDYNYPLPEDKIAKYPLDKRENSNLLVYDKGLISKDIFKNIDNYIPNKNLMVFNNAKVVSARLLFRKFSGASIEIFCLEPYQPTDYALAFQQKEKSTWTCIVGNLKKWKSDILEKHIEIKSNQLRITAKKVERKGRNVIVEFAWDNSEITFGEILDHAGMVPIPPYLKRESEEIDKQRYQTKYSKIKGSVAAPTAGLHFEENTINKLKSKGVEQEEITLHVGAGTFRPVQTETVEDHTMHTEHFSVSLETINRILDNSENILAVGTTTVRTMESLYWLGNKLLTGQVTSQKLVLNQWEHAKLDDSIPVKKSLESLKAFIKERNDDKINASTQIMITPGYEFKLTSAMITNFHQPKSTLLMLIAAFVGEDWKRIYSFALENDFRFLSYGDSSLLIPKNKGAK